MKLDALMIFFSSNSSFARRRFLQGCVAAAVGISLTIGSCLAPLAHAEDTPPAKIDVGALPAKIVDDVVVPVPTEVFGVLDKLGSPNWHAVLRRTLNVNPGGERPKVALLLGTVIAEGFIAVEAQEPEEVKKIGRSVLSLAGAIGVRKSVISRTNSIIDAADKKDWKRVRIELDGASQDVKQSMIELKDEQLAQLVSLGGWLRGTEALTQVVSKNYTKDSAELLHQPALVDHFQRQIDAMSPRLQRHPLVKKVRSQLPEIRALIEDPDSISAQKVNQIRTITEELVKEISAQES